MCASAQLNKRREGPNTLATLPASVPPLDDGRRPPTARVPPPLDDSSTGELRSWFSSSFPRRLAARRAVLPAPASDSAPRPPRACAAAAPLLPLRAGTRRAAARVRPRQGRPRSIRRLQPPRLGLLTSGDPLCTTSLVSFGGQLEFLLPQIPAVLPIFISLSAVELNSLQCHAVYILLDPISCPEFKSLAQLT